MGTTEAPVGAGEDRAEAISADALLNRIASEAEGIPGVGDAETLAEAARRRLYLGGSDAPRLMGVGYGGPHDVYQEKLGLVAPKPQTFKMWFGLMMEPTLAKWCREKLGMKLRRSTKTFFHPEFPFIGGTPDAVVRKERKHKLASFKTTNPRFAHLWGEPGTDEVPEAVIIQETQYMGVLNDGGGDFQSSLIFPLIGNEEPEPYEVHFNHDLWEAMKEREVRFWNEHVLAKLEPVLDGSEGAWKSIELRHPRAGAGLIQATPEIEELAGVLKSFYDQAKTIETKIEVTKQLLADFIGDKEGLDTSLGKIYFREGKGQISWKNAAEAAGITEADAEPFRGESPGRVLRPYLGKGKKK